MKYQVKKRIPLALFAIIAGFTCTGNAAVTIRLGESTPGSATLDAGAGGQAVVGVFASSDGTGVTGFDAFDLYLDLLGDGNDDTNFANQGFSFPESPVIAGAVFTNAAAQDRSNGTLSFTNADLQVSADRSLFTFGAAETKLFDLLINVAPTATAGTYTIALRDDSGFFLAINDAGANLLQSQPGQFTFTPGTLTLNAAAVPEPGSLAILSLGMGICFTRRRRR